MNKISAVCVSLALPVFLDLEPRSSFYEHSEISWTSPRHLEARAVVWVDVGVIVSLLKIGDDRKKERMTKKVDSSGDL